MSHINLSTSFLIICLGLSPYLAQLSAAEESLEVRQIRSCAEQEAVKASTPAAEVYAIFNQFCLDNYGTKAEPLVHQLFGKDLTVITEGTWIHLSEHSACVALETNLPAWCKIAYGKGRKLNLSSELRERPFTVHIHYLKDLEPNTTYQWQAIFTDENGVEVRGELGNFTTVAESTWISFPCEQSSSPYIIDKPGKYLLSRDINANTTAIEIKADNVSLDLGGHRVIYGNDLLAKEHFEDKWMSYINKGSFGIKSIGHHHIEIYNGIIQQGEASNRGNDESAGFNPLYLRSLSDVILAGLEVDYHSPQIAGIRNRDAGDNYLVHHNLIRDRGTMMHNRHGSGCSAIDFLASKGGNRIMHHNLVARTRQNGLRGSPDLSYHNEVYVDSWATNSFATSIKDGGELHHNRIFATGYHAIAVPWGDKVNIHHNFIHMQGINTGKTRWWEDFGDQNSMNGLRHTQWGKNTTTSAGSSYDHNTVCIYGRNGAQIRGVEFFSDTYINNLCLSNSTIKVISQDSATTKAACVATHGNPEREDTQNPVFYRNNEFISNLSIIRIGDDYGKGSHHHFFNNTFTRLGARPEFHTFVAMGTYFSRYHRFVDCIFGAGTAADDIDWTDTKPDSRNYDLEWTLSVQAEKNAPILIKDALGNVVVDSKADSEGHFSTPLKQFRMSLSQQTQYTPHSVTINGKSHSVTMDQIRSLTLP